jgi:hypothetical protein
MSAEPPSAAAATGGGGGGPGGGGSGPAAPSERPKRDAAKKFLNGVEAGGKIDGRKALVGPGDGARGAGPRKAGKVPDSAIGAKRPAAGSVGGVDADKKRPRPQDMGRADIPKVSVDAGIRRLDLTALKRYKKHFNLKNTTTSNKDDLQAAVIRHFASQLRADAGKTERSFLKFLKERKSEKQD